MNRSCRLAGLAVAALLLSRQALAAQQGDVLGAAIIGAATGTLVGIALIIDVWLWKPYRERAKSKKAKFEEAKYAALAATLPKLAVLAAQGDTDGVAHLLAQGADANDSGPSGQTPLMLAARNGHADVVELLLLRGADPTMTTKLGSTAADIARTYRREHVAKLIDTAMQQRFRSHA